MTQVLLIGNPNCGKTTLFNALTGDNQRVGNWPGVTVEKKTGIVSKYPSIEIIDLPGVYSLVAQGKSQDEQIAAQAIVSMESDCIINVLDACHLERHLYLTSQILELGKPVIVALNMMDIAQERGISIDIKALEQQLGCPVIPIQAHKNIGITFLEQALMQDHQTPSPFKLTVSEIIQELISQLNLNLKNKGYAKNLAYFYSLRILEGYDGFAEESSQLDLAVFNENGLSLDVLLADARYQKIHQIISVVQKKKSDASEHFTAKLDRIVLHRFWALPIFLGLMYLMFLFAINVGGAFQDFFDIATDTIFVQGSAWLLQQLHAPEWVIALIANGIGKGINTVITFIPVIAAMFFFLSLLETSGYMARAAFVVDKIMRVLGLPGKSFVPMIVGFGCNVPAIMAARTLDSERDRLLTVLMSPFMSCSARLAIYTVFVAAFFPTGGQNIVFSLYLIGILMALLTGFLLRKTILKGQSSPLILELPLYHKPILRRLFKETFFRLRFFISRAGKLIVPVCIILGGLNALSLHKGSPSLLALMGQAITPLFSPIGITSDNWPATVGLLTGMLAKEVVIGTLNSLYAQLGDVGIASPSFDLFHGIQAALWSIPNNLSQLGSAVWHPLKASAGDSQLSASVYGIMFNHFDGKIGAYSYLLFILLYIPCVSTMAVIRQEANKKFMWFSVIWSLFVAYTSALVFYQIAKFLEHPQQSFFWISASLIILLAVIVLFVWSGQKNLRSSSVASNT